MATSTMEMSLHATVQMTKKLHGQWKEEPYILNLSREMPKEGDNERRRKGVYA